MKEQFSAPIASITVDCVIFGFRNDALEVLLVKRSSEPESGTWALPGGFMEKDETVEIAAERVLQLMTGVSDIFMRQTGVFSAIDRHPIDRVITVGFMALINPDKFSLQSREHASEAKWFTAADVSNLPFDHADIVKQSLQQLRSEIRYQPVGFELLPERFTLRELQLLYEAIAGETLDRRNFRRKIKAMDMLVELKEKRTGAHKSADLFRFDQKKYDQLVAKGFAFQL